MNQCNTLASIRDHEVLMLHQLLQWIVIDLNGIAPAPADTTALHGVADQMPPCTGRPPPDTCSSSRSNLVKLGQT
jgi:hypothetical protein